MNFFPYIINLCFKWISMLERVNWPNSLVVMILALGVSGLGFKSRFGPLILLKILLKECCISFVIILRKNN